MRQRERVVGTSRAEDIFCQFFILFSNHGFVRSDTSLGCRSHQHTIKSRKYFYLDLGDLQIISLQWCHNEHDAVSNHHRPDCLLNRLFRNRSKKTSKLRVTCLCEGNPPVTGGFPSQRPVTRKMYPFDDVIMFPAIYTLVHHPVCCNTLDFAKMRTMTGCLIIYRDIPDRVVTVPDWKLT